MVILEDSRQKPSKHKNISAYFEAEGITFQRTKLYVGDYQVANNGSISVDTKQDMQEVYGDLIQQHERFKAECQRAQEAEVILIILVEDGSIPNLEAVHTWKNPRLYYWARNKKGRPPVDSKRLQHMMEIMTERYGVRWEFCDPKDTGKRIIELLTN